MKAAFVGGFVGVSVSGQNAAALSTVQNVSVVKAKTRRSAMIRMGGLPIERGTSEVYKSYVDADSAARAESIPSRNMDELPAQSSPTPVVPPIESGMSTSYKTLLNDLATAATQRSVTSGAGGAAASNTKPVMTRSKVIISSNMSSTFRNIMESQKSTLFSRLAKSMPEPEDDGTPNWKVRVFFTGAAQQTNVMDTFQSATVKVADQYLSNSLKQQFKAAAIPSGVYLPQCTEGTVKGAAEHARVSALAKQFRMKQRSPAAAAFDLFEGRRMAIKAVAHDCEYEEAIFRKFVAAGATFVLGTSEKALACDRYVTEEGGAANAFMERSVQRAMKQRATGGGIYGTSCMDGSVKGMAEDARIAGEAVKYRARQMSAGAKEGAKFAARKQARDWFTNGCEYEEGLVAKFPEAAAAMRPATTRY
eukprot:CAMPEP_0185845638 /NCGR_PEP_ID=MMETSP1354-20130828/1545_1 /TAXON_ID=708628 /ORGANISM="Erythrolobus madagascarensis, Strain CCMP3276" /LENGTH=419 /DNA_ID=CAMNT_0028545635 /DNA_START=33 /DNA_END=1292 /DNA_ORIENTATION=-